MATSGSTNWKLTRDSIVTAALRKLRVVDPNQTAPAADIVTGAEALNALIKSWQLRGVSILLNSTVSVTLAASQSSYSFSSAAGAAGARFVELLEARLRDSGSNDEPVEIHPSLEEFRRRITDPTATGDITDVYYQPGASAGTLYVYPVADDVTKTLQLTVRRVVEDFDAASDDADFPAEATRALVWNLALELAPEYGKEVTQTVASMAQSTFADLFDFYRSRDPIRLRPAR